MVSGTLVVDDSTGASGKGSKSGGDLVEVHCDYISADKPIKKKFSSSATVAEVKKWAREEFVPNPPSDKIYYLSDEKTRHRFTDAEELQTLEQVGYKNEAKLRLNEEQAAGS